MNTQQRKAKQEGSGVGMASEGARYIPAFAQCQRKVCDWLRHAVMNAVVATVTVDCCKVKVSVLSDTLTSPQQSTVTVATAAAIMRQCL